MKNRLEKQQRIREKGFAMNVTDREDIMPDMNSRWNDAPVDFSKIKVGAKTLQDAIVELGGLQKNNRTYTDQERIYKAIADKDYVLQRDISNYWFEVSGIYSRVCRYMAFMFRYDWVLVPYSTENRIKGDNTPVPVMGDDGEKSKNASANKKLVDGFYKALDYLDESEIKRLLQDIALKTIVNGCYYGYLIRGSESASVQELPPNYCRSRYKLGNNPAVEFNMKFFDDYYNDTSLRMKVLGLFPPEFAKGYSAYKKGTLPKDYPGDESGWYLLDPECAFKFNIYGKDAPMFINAIPALIDLDEARGIDKKKMQQQLLKIIVQQMPIDKNGELIFDVDEAQALHNNAVKMLGRAVGIDVLTTFADVEVANMAENNNTQANDAMDRTKSSVFDNFGVSELQFNSTGNIALTNSILNDEAAVLPLVTDFESFLNKFLLKPFNKNKKMKYKVQILNTTIYNYKDMAKLYKEQMQLGYSKMLAQIALGQSQRSVLASAIFENDVLDLVSVFIPPLMSSTMNGDFLTNRNGNNNDGGSNNNKQSASNNQQPAQPNDKTSGRPEKADNEKSTKTLQNKESQS